jgi:hypothetical protein
MTKKNMKPKFNSTFGATLQRSSIGDVTSKELTPETMQKIAIGDASGRGTVVTTVTVATQRTLSDSELKAILKASARPGSANKPMIGKSPSSKRGK